MKYFCSRLILKEYGIHKITITFTRNFYLPFNLIIYNKLLTEQEVAVDQAHSTFIKLWESEKKRRRKKRGDSSAESGSAGNKSQTLC